MSESVVAEHLVRITPEYGDYDPADPDAEANLEVICAGVTDGCRLWVECLDGEHGDPEEHDYDDTDFHGITHQWIDGSWMVPTQRCIFVWHHSENGGDAAWDVLHEVGRVPGEYPVHATWEGEWALLELLTPEEVGA